MQNRRYESRSVVERFVLLFCLPLHGKCLDYLLVLSFECVLLAGVLLGFLHAVALVAQLSLLHPVLEPERGDFEGLPLGLGLKYAFREGELFNIFGFFDALDGPVVHAVSDLFQAESRKVVREQLVFEQREHPLEKVADSGIHVVVVVVLHPLLHVVQVLLGRQHYLVVPLGHLPHNLSDVGVHPQEAALLDLQHPLLPRQHPAVHHFKHGAADLHVFPIHQQKGRHEIVLLLAVGAAPENFAVVDVHERLWVAGLITARHDIGFVDDFA